MPSPQFTSTVEAAENMFLEPAQQIDSTDLWTALWHATRSDTARSRGKRHIIVFSRSAETRIAGHGLVSNVQAGCYHVHAISSVENPELLQFCQRTNSVFEVSGEEEIPELIRHAYLGLQARYEIVYQPVAASAETLKIRVQSAEGVGETTVAL
jgi:hypothetical protein